MTEEEILAAARKLHDAEVGERHCDPRYLRSCPKFAQAILDAGKAARQTPERCGARLTVELYRCQPQTWTCVLGPHDFNDRHRAADGTSWRATDFPPMAAPVDSGQLDAVDAALKCVGLGFDTRVNDIGDLAGQRDSHAEHAKNCEDALARIADQANNSGSDMNATMRRIVAITQERDR